MEDNNNLETYLTYNGLGRKATVAGVPYLAAMGTISIGSLFSMFVAIYFDSILGILLLPLFFVPLIYIRTICDQDSLAFDVLLIEIKWWFISKVSGGMSKELDHVLVIFPDQFGENKRYVNEYFKETTERK